MRRILLGTACSQLMIDDVCGGFASAWWVTLTVRLAVTLLKFAFGNEASCSTRSVCSTAPALVYIVNKYTVKAITYLWMY